MEVVMTAFKDKGRELIRELAGLGVFWETNFKDVVRGEIDDLNRFIDELGKRAPYSLSRLSPIENSFQFSPENVAHDFKKEAEPLVSEIAPGETFCVRICRRGLRGMFSSQEAASEVGSHIRKMLAKRYGVKVSADLQNPDRALIFETIDEWCGVGRLPKEMRRKCTYVKLP